MIEPIRKARKVALALGIGMGLLVVMEAVQIGLTVILLWKG